MQWDRTERLAEAMRQELTEIIEYEMSDERIQRIKVASVKVSQDQRNVTVLVDVDGNDQEVKDSLTAVRKAAGFIRYQLAQRLQFKRAPELAFQYDETIKKAARIEQLLGEEKEREQET
jgi:ribosome-binding factor A